MSKKEKNISYVENRNIFRVRLKRDNYLLLNKDCKTLKEAIAIRDRTIKDYEIQRKNGIVTKNINVTFGDCFNAITEIYGKNSDYEYSNYNGFKKSTLENYKKTYNGYLKKLENIRMVDINNGILKKSLNEIKGRNKNGSLSTMRYRAKVIVNKVLDYAEENNIIVPFVRTFGKEIKKPLGVQLDERKNFITVEQFFQIKDNFLKIPCYPKSSYEVKDIRFCFLLLYYTGLRIGEARGLKVSDFMISSEGLAFIFVQRQREEGTDKIVSLKGNHKPRKVFLDADIYFEFTDFFQEKHYNENNYVLDFNKDGNIIKRQKISRKIKDAIKTLQKMNLIDKSIYFNLSPQGLRISNNKYLKWIGVNEERSASMQGHTVATAHKYYSTLGDNIEDCFKKINK